MKTSLQVQNPPIEDSHRAALGPRSPEVPIDLPIYSLAKDCLLLGLGKGPDGNQEDKAAKTAASGYPLNDIPHTKGLKSLLSVLFMQSADLPS